MNIKKILLGTLFSAALYLTACSDGNNVGNDNSAETVSETVPEAEEAVSEVSEEKSDTLTICGKEYSSEDIYIEIDGNTVTETDMENIRRLKSLSAVSIENPTLMLVEMFAEDTNVTKIKLSRFDGDIAEYIDALKNFDIVSVDALSYSGKDSALIYSELSDASVFYEKNSDGLFLDMPKDGIALSTSVCVLPNGRDDFDTWNTYPETLTVGISNFTDTAQTAQKLELFYESENGDEAVLFKSGESFLPLDITAEPQGKAVFTVDGNMLDYRNAGTGVYKVKITFENGEAENEFVIANSNGLEFMTEEQRELFDKTRELSVNHTSESWTYHWSSEKEPVNISDEAMKTLCECYTYGYVSEHTDRFCINSDGSLGDGADGRSGSPVYEITFFTPVSVSGEQVDFKATVVNFHGDDPYFVWFRELNYRMVKTEDGWRFDKFQFWR